MPKDVFTQQLLDKLEKIANATNKPLEKRMIQLAVWYYRNNERITQVEKRLEFHDIFINNLLETMVMMLERIQKAEGRGSSSSLWLPSGMSLEGDLERFE